MIIELDDSTLEDIEYYYSCPLDESALIHLGDDLIRLYEEQRRRDD